MKLAFILLGLFLLLISVRNQARELTQKERLALVPWQNTKVVKEYMEKETRLNNLGLSDFLAFKALKKSCVPLTKTIETIEQEAEDYPDKSQHILQVYALCSEGTMGLSRLYIKSRQP